MKSEKCPNCEQFKTKLECRYYISLGLGLFGFGVLLLIIPFIGIPLIFIGFCAFLTGCLMCISEKYSKRYICNNCQHKFYIDKTIIQQKKEE